MSATPAERRNRTASLSSGPIDFYEKDAPPPSHGEELARETLEKLAARETLEKLERAGRVSRARWKIQIWIKSDRSVYKPLTFSLAVWESGKRLHGGGDESTFICRRNPSAPKPKAPPFGALGRSSFKAEASPNGCDNIIPGELAVGGFVVCPHCGMRWDTEHIADSLFYRVPVERAATIITDWFHRLGSDCDIYVKFRAEDVRTKMMARDYGVHIAKQLKGLVIYPLWRIIDDTAGGASLENRFKTLLMS